MAPFPDGGGGEEEEQSFLCILFFVNIYFPKVLSVPSLNTSLGRFVFPLLGAVLLSPELSLPRSVMTKEGTYVSLSLSSWFSWARHLKKEKLSLDPPEFSQADLQTTFLSLRFSRRVFWIPLIFGYNLVPGLDLRLWATVLSPFVVYCRFSFL